MRTRGVAAARRVGGQTCTKPLRRRTSRARLLRWLSGTSCSNVLKHGDGVSDGSIATVVDKCAIPRKGVGGVHLDFTSLGICATMFGVA